MSASSWREKINMMKLGIGRRKTPSKVLFCGAIVLVSCFAAYVLVMMLRVESMQEVVEKYPDSIHYPNRFRIRSTDEQKHQGQRSGSNDSFPLHYRAPLDVPRVAEYCNIPNAEVVLGEEGEAPADFQLVSAQVLIRHGDRTPMTSYLNIPRPSPPGGCILDPHLLEAQPELKNFIADMEAQKDRQSPRSEFHRWSLYPRMRVCGNSHLTGVGAVQQMYSGLALKEKYINKWNIFGERFSPSTQLHLQSTMLSRTYQSAIAFLYSFLPRFNVSEFDIRVSKNTIFCNPAYVPFSCCESLGHLRQEAERRGPKKNMKNPLRKPAYEKIAEVFGVRTGQLPWPSALMDLFQGYICHNLLLPCGPQDKCISAEIMQSLWAVMDSDGLALVRDPKIEQYSRLITHSLLSEIHIGMARAARNLSPVRFSLYSGHDITITPLLHTLGVHDGKWPQYASRLVFELYRRMPFSKEHFIRIIYNGKDLTSQVRFCQGRTEQGMCSLRHLRNFVATENLVFLGVSEKGGLQKLCQAKSLMANPD